MFLNRAVASIFLILLTASPLSAARIENVQFDDSCIIQDIKLTVRGVALLRYMIFIKAYVGAFYLDQDHQTSDLFNDAAKRLELSYFHAIPAADFVKSTKIMIEKNVTAAEFNKLLPEIEQMNSLYQDVKPGDRYAATYIPGVGTELSLNGKPLGIVSGYEFANAYFSIWLGKNPIDMGFRDHLTGKK